MSRKPRDFPTWHFGMVNDHVRNAAIEASIAELDPRGKTVFEIGSGCGLIALLFAKYGAERVVTCEVNGSLASTAARIIEASGYADRIELYHASSTELIRAGLAPMEPDIIFTETLDCGVIGEGYFAVAADIAEVAGPRTHVMPVLINQFLVPVESEVMAGLNRVGMTCGFDLSALNGFSTQTYFPVHSSIFPHRHLAEHVLTRTYTYHSISVPVPQVIDIESDGQLHGLLSWFKADFGAGIVSNRPGLTSHWHQAFHPMHQDLAVKRGGRLSVVLDDHGQAHVARLPR